MVIHGAFHVNFVKGTIAGLYQDSTLMVENLTQIKNESFGDAVHIMSAKDMKDVAQALEIQMPFLTLMKKIYNYQKPRQNTVACH